MLKRLRGDAHEGADRSGAKSAKPREKATVAVAGNEPKGKPSGPPPAPPRRKKKRSGRRR